MSRTSLKSLPYHHFPATCWGYKARAPKPAPKWERKPPVIPGRFSGCCEVPAGPRPSGENPLYMDSLEASSWGPRVPGAKHKSETEKRGERIYRWWLKA